MPHRTSEHASTAPRILFLDAYDSFTNNIVALVQRELDADVTIVKIDDSRYLHDPKAFWTLMQGYDAVVAGPGPGAPDNPTDIGLIQKLWDLPNEHLLPVLGICLGFQSLACAHGAKVIRLHEPRHGIVSTVHHCDSSIFANVGRADVVQYQSLHARIDVGLAERQLRRDASNTWTPSPACPLLRPLAWVLTDEVNGPTLMGVAHTSKPFWGLQFHPESICTTFEGASIIRNWWTESQRWRLSSRPCKIPAPPRQSRQSKKLEINLDITSPALGLATSPQDVNSHTNGSPLAESVARRVQHLKLPLQDADAADICDALRKADQRIIMLESGIARSGKQVNTETGRFSIFGVVDAISTEQLLYFVHDQCLVHVRGGVQTGVVTASNIWDHVKGFMDEHQAFDGPSESPFWGGLIGFASYESCLETINVAPSQTPSDRPDVCFTFVERSVVFDHVEGVAYIQSIRPEADSWIAETSKLLSTVSSRSSSGLKTTQHLDNQRRTSSSRLQEPQEDSYSAKIRSCQSSIRAGDSYELCLTDQTSILRSDSPSSTPWSLYRRLRTLNPAPFSAYLHFPALALTTRTTPSLSILSSSPERFLSWDRAGHAQLRPIKGTVAKSPGMTRPCAEVILSTSKERAENLMIVDLIRHDLHGVVGAGGVRVAKLMRVEEYESVFQLVSVIEGELGTGPAAPKGIDVLAASLPPGSMTGAPKKRSCELLRGIEGDEPRGIYSGVLGYLDVGGGGDFAVVIRTAWSWGDEDRVVEMAGADSASARIWHVGAGGAVTSQSTEKGEWEEMLTKRAALLRLFDDDG